jgi:DNA-directed RNA polymerase specialized sigma24 family protein
MNCKDKAESKKQLGKAAVSQYASSQDFCRLFTEKMNSLYWLAFLLTADHEKARECFVAGLEDCVQAERVFQSWAHRWAKRTIIENAIQTLKPRLIASVARAAIQSSAIRVAGDSEFRRVLALEDYERFVFVMSVLERYSDHESALLLDCPARYIREARSRAFQQIADPVCGAQVASFVRLRREEGSVAARMR